MMKHIKYFIFTVCGIIVLYLLLTVFASGTHGELDCIAVNERNGDVAISFYKETHAYVKVFDAEGNELITRGLDSGGGLISYMYFEDDVLHVQNTRMSREILYDRNGEMITAFDVEYPEGFYWEGWQKDGSRYIKQVDKMTYIYDYPAFYETLWKPLKTFYLVTESGETVCLWDSKMS